MTLALPRLDRSTAADRGLTLADFLVPIRLAERTPPRIRHLVLIAVGTAVVALTAQIYIPTTPVPFTGQTFGVLVVGGALGFRRGAAALLQYIAIGALGVPVYAQGESGMGTLFGATGGYLIGFVAAAAVVGRLAELGWDRRLGGAFTTMLVGTAIIYAVGVPWLKAATGMTWSESIATGLTPFLAWDMAKLAIAAVIFPTAWWLVGRRPEDR
jgi:biotin transport system substrate-specific component